MKTMRSMASRAGTGLIGYVERLDQVRTTHLTAMAERMRADEQVSSRQSWENTAVLLEVLISGLTPKLKEVLALRGVRFYEMEILDRYAAEIPIYCRLLLELHDTGSSAVAAMQATLAEASAERDPGIREQNRRDLLACHAAVSHRLVGLLVKVDKTLQDLVAFLPIWLQAIEKRRALLLRRAAEEPTGATLLT